MNTWQQQDAQEYFSKILDQLDKESTTVSEKLSRSKGFALLFDEERVDAESAYRNALKNPLEGLVAQRVGCLRCGYSEGLSFTQFNCLTVPLGPKRYYDIRECLDEYANLERINGVECPKCTILHTKTQLENVLSGSLPEGLKKSVLERLQIVDNALQNEDFSDNTLIKKCVIPKKNWVSTTKSKQTIVGRPPRNLVIHVNRSLFDEHTGAQLKNYAHIRSPLHLDLGPWCIGQVHTSNSEEPAKLDSENWETDPRKSMLPPPGASVDSPWKYELRAAIMHYGRHENGHYVCYRTYPDRQLSEDEQDDMNPEQFKGWWRLSDETVSRVSVTEMQEEGEVFMLFYERVEGADYNSTALSVQLAADLGVAVDIALPEDDDLDLSEAGEDTSFFDCPSDPIFTDEESLVEIALPQNEEPVAEGGDGSNPTTTETVQKAANEATKHSSVSAEPTTPDPAVNDSEAGKNTDQDSKRILALVSSGFFNSPPSSSPANPNRSPMMMRTAGKSNPHDSEDLLGSGLRIVSAI
jgi:ubiquitin carboxyl-terminal hydrolase 1